MNNKLLVATKACMAAAFLACSVPGGQAQTLNVIQQLDLSGTADFNLTTGEAFSVGAAQIEGGGAGNTVQPFQITTGSSAATFSSIASPSVVGNAGQSSITITYDRTGFLPIQEGEGTSLTNVIGNGSVTAVAGITPFGGDALNGGATLTNVPSRIILNQDATTGLPGITIAEFASSTDTDGNPVVGATAALNGASITGTLTGASKVMTGVVNTRQIINSLTVFE